jgi:hypothetical protein
MGSAARAEVMLEQYASAFSARYARSANSRSSFVGSYVVQITIRCFAPEEGWRCHPPVGNCAAPDPRVDAFMAEPSWQRSAKPTRPSCSACWSKITPNSKRPFGDGPLLALSWFEPYWTISDHNRKSELPVTLCERLRCTVIILLRCTIFIFLCRDRI